VVTIHDLLLTNFLRWHGRTSVSIACPFPYSGIRAILGSLRYGSCTYTWYVMVRFMWWIYSCMNWLDQSWLMLAMLCDWMISSHSFSVMCATCLYQLESPLGLTMHIVGRLSQWIEVMCHGLLMKIEEFRIDWIWVDLINPMWFSEWFNRCDLLNPLLFVVAISKFRYKAFYA
jgi:hypothetical protein